MAAAGSTRTLGVKVCCVATIERLNAVDDDRTLGELAELLAPIETSRIFVFFVRHVVAN